MADDAFNKLKNVFNKGVTSINVKTSTLLEVAKLKTCISTLQEDIKASKSMLGEKVYLLWEQGSLSAEEVQAECEQIRLKTNEIVKLQQKIVDLEEESKQILEQKSYPVPPPVQIPPQGVQNVYRCPHCGAEFNSPANFCKKCGGKMQE